MQLVIIVTMFSCNDGKKTKSIIYNIFRTHDEKNHYVFCKLVNNFTLIFAQCKTFYKISSTLVNKNLRKSRKFRKFPLNIFAF